MFSPTKPRTVSIFFAGVTVEGGRLACGEMSFHLLCLVVLLILSVYPNDQRKNALPSFTTQVSSVISFSAYQYNFRNENSICRFSQPIGKKGSMHTFISCCMDMSRRKVLEAPSRVTSATSFLY